MFKSVRNVILPQGFWRPSCKYGDQLCQDADPTTQIKAAITYYLANIIHLN